MAEEKLPVSNNNDTLPMSNRHSEHSINHSFTLDLPRHHRKFVHHHHQHGINTARTCRSILTRQNMDDFSYHIDDKLCLLYGSGWRSKQTDTSFEKCAIICSHESRDDIPLLQEGQSQWQWQLAKIVILVKQGRRRLRSVIHKVEKLSCVCDIAREWLTNVEDLRGQCEAHEKAAIDQSAARGRDQRLYAAKAQEKATTGRKALGSRSYNAPTRIPGHMW